MRAGVFRRAAVGAVSAVLVGALAAVPACAPAWAAAVAPAAQPGDPPGTQRYVVRFRPDASDAAQERVRGRARDRGGEVRRTYGRALKGFAAALTPDGVREVRDDPSVASVEADVLLHVSDVQPSPPWGLDRIDQRAAGLSGSYTYGGTGAGVRAYVVDSGVRADHAEFGGRVTAGYAGIADGNGTEDCAQHGTHVAGIIGGSTYGVAKGVTIVPVRVFDCTGQAFGSDVIAGFDWVLANQVPGKSVVNFSAGGPASQDIDDAVANTVAAGIPVVVAAGNENADACTTSPARTATAITVGATTQADARASFSNWGSCVDVFAPGNAIPSAWPTGPTATAVRSGTSMATPHVTGVVAAALQAAPGATPAALAGSVVATATSGVVTDGGAGSPNRLLFAPPAYRLAGAGTATTGPFLAALGADPTALAVGALRQVDALATSGLSPVAAQDPATYPACTINRPATGGAARAALLGSLASGDGCLQFAGAEYADLSPASPRLAYIPFARDNVTFTISVTSNLPTNMTSSQLRAIYACSLNPAWHPMLPAVGSGLREFWISLVYPQGKPNPLPSCVQDGTDEVGSAIGPNSGVQIGNSDVTPYSLAQWTAQVAGVVGDQHAHTRVGQIDSRSPFADNFGVQRDLYVAVPDAALTGPSLADFRTRKAFVGPASLLCLAMTGPIPKRYGFRPSPSCGSTALRTP